MPRMVPRGIRAATFVTAGATRADKFRKRRTCRPVADPDQTLESKFGAPRCGSTQPSQPPWVSLLGAAAAMGCCCLSPEGAHGDGGEKEKSTGSQNRLLPDLVFKAVLADERATQEFLKFTQAEFSSENLEFYLARPHVSTCGRSALAPRPRAAARPPLPLARCRAVAWRCCCGRGLRLKPQLWATGPAGPGLLA